MAVDVSLAGYGSAMPDNNENDANVPLVDGVLANEGVVDHSRDELGSEDAKGEDAAEQSDVEPDSDLADPMSSKDVGGEA
jgi:hypothetical protein